MAMKQADFSDELEGMMDHRRLINRIVKDDDHDPANLDPDIRDRLRGLYDHLRIVIRRPVIKNAKDISEEDSENLDKVRQTIKSIGEFLGEDE
jgi:hypothetical protein